jgi:hypothetical protein
MCNDIAPCKLLLFITWYGSQTDIWQGESITHTLTKALQIRGRLELDVEMKKYTVLDSLEMGRQRVLLYHCNVGFELIG